MGSGTKGGNMSSPLPSSLPVIHLDTPGSACLEVILLKSETLSPEHTLISFIVVKYMKTKSFLLTIFKVYSSMALRAFPLL